MSEIIILQFLQYTQQSCQLGFEGSYLIIMTKETAISFETRGFWKILWNEVMDMECRKYDLLMLDEVLLRLSPPANYTYEERLQQSLAIDGYLTYIVGPSKIGKTVLCEKVIGAANMVCMSGNDFSKEKDFWSGIGKKVGISMEAAVSEKSAAFSDKEQKSMTVTKNYFVTKDRVIDYFKENEKVLVLDDFHYAPSEMQYDIACQLKEVIRMGFKAVVVSLPYRSDDAMQLMQSICLNIGLLPGNSTEITDETIEESCSFTCMNLPYGDVVRVLKAGLSTRGQQRLQYTLTDGSKKDIYGLVLKVLSDNPPLIELSIEELMERIRNNVSGNGITTKKIRDSLKNWQKLLDTLGSLYQVLEWKDDMIHVLDNMFLFYIRWKLE